MRPMLRVLAMLLLVAACGRDPTRRVETVLYASGADLQSINPLFTVHPLARQVQRYVLLTTLIRRDSLLRMEPYLARKWTWSPDRRRLTFRLFAGLRWHDGTPTTAYDAAWTLDRARDPATGYPRRSELAGITEILATDDTTLVLGFDQPQADLPDVLTDLALLPRHRFFGVAPAALRQAPWQVSPVGNGPFRFVTHEANRRWVFERNPDFPPALGGPPEIRRLVIAVVDQPLTKLAALAAGELDLAGIQPAHAEYVRRDSTLRVVDYPLLFSTTILFNTRRAVFGTPGARRAVAAAIDRQAVVDGAVYGYGTVATGPVPPGISSREGAGENAAPPADLPGKRLEFELISVGSGEAVLEQLIQAQLAMHGIVARIRQLELSTFLDRVYGASHDFDAALLGVPGDPGLGHLAPLAALSGLTPPLERDALLRFFRDSVPATFVYHARGLQGLSRRLEGVEFGLRGELASVTRWRVRSP